MTTPPLDEDKARAVAEIKRQIATFERILEDVSTGRITAREAVRLTAAIWGKVSAMDTLADSCLLPDGTFECRSCGFRAHGVEEFICSRDHERNGCEALRLAQNHHSAFAAASWVMRALHAELERSWRDREAQRIADELHTMKPEPGEEI
jgi:hypothetical protein